MKILIFLNSYWNLVNFRTGLLERLISDGFDVVVVSPIDFKDSRTESLNFKHIPIKIDRKGINPLRDIILFLRFILIAYNENPSKILTFTIKPNIYGSLAARFLKIDVINNVTGLGTTFIKENFLTTFVKYLYRLSFAKSKMVFFQNNDDMQLFLKEGMVNKKNIGLLPGSGINLKKYYYADLPKLRDLKILFIGRVLSDKGVYELIDAARTIKQKKLNISISILGLIDHENKTSISLNEIEGWNDDGIISYLGSCDDVRDHIRNHHCLILPSYREGLPRTLLEGAAMGRPLIATNVPGCKDVIEHGVNGYLCNVKDSMDIVLSIEKLYSLPFDSIKKMGVLGRDKVRTEFDEKIVIEKYLDILNHLS
tara:strand:+ start:1008 stop:2111 length:1104 start_codon:yes stop_codon:yes gene_type:complete